MERGRGRERERTRGPDRRRVGEITQGPLTVDPVTPQPVITQLPAIGSHHQVLEQPVLTPRGLTATRQESSDADPEKKAPDLKKPKLEPKDEQSTQMDEPMSRIDHSAAFGPHEVFDLTAGDEPGSDELQRAELPPQLSTSIAKDPGPFPGMCQRGSGSNDAPEWVQDLSKSLRGLHVKSDKTHSYCLELGATIQQHGTRIEHLEACHKETTDQQTHTLARIAALEKVVADLEKQPRSPTPGRHQPPSPRSPRTPRGAFETSPRDPQQDLGLVIGGWVDARSGEAEEEVRNMFQAAGVGAALENVSGPAGRTNFLRASLQFPKDATLSQKRQLQKEVLDKLKQLKCSSGIEGQNGTSLRVQRDRPLEERLRIRALVLTKNFYTALPALAGRPHLSPPEIVWRGQVFVGQTRLLRCMDEGHEPAATDQIIEDSKGNHTVWFLSSQAFETVTGRNKETLQQTWLDYGPSASPLGGGGVA